MPADSFWAKLGNALLGAFVMACVLASVLSNSVQAMLNRARRRLGRPEREIDWP